jgi:hypothetical protein
MKNPFYSYDRRLGVSLVKVHVPVGSANAYFIADIEGAKNIDEIAYVGRFELPINVLNCLLLFYHARTMQHV